MCLPAAAAAVLVAAAAHGVSIVAQNQQAKAVNKALKQQNAQRTKEIDQASAQEINNRLREMRREQARIQVAAGEAGLSLSSGGVEALLLDSAMQAELANDASLANRESRKRALDAETNASFQARTTTLGAGLQIGLAGAGAYIGSQRRAQTAESGGN